MATDGGSEIESRSIEPSRKQVTPPKFSRRTFLKGTAKWGGAAVVTTALAGAESAWAIPRLVKWFADKTKKPILAQEDESKSRPFESSRFDVAVNEFQQKYPDRVETIKPILEGVDREGAENLSVFKPDNDPDLAVPFTKVSVNNVLSKKSLQTKPNPPQKKIYVVFGGFAAPPDGHPFTAWDIVYDRAINSIPQAVFGREVDIYSIGFPQGLGGKVSEQYFKGIQTSAKAYADLYGQFVKKILEENPDAKIVLQGMSFGSSIAELAAGELDEDQRSKVQLLLDNPAADHEADLSRDLQVGLGFGAEGLARMLLDPKIKAQTAAEDPLREDLKKVLTQKGIDWEDDPNQTDLKQQTAKIDALNVTRGIRLDKKHRLFIRQGLSDPTSVASDKAKESSKQGPKNRIIAETEGRALKVWLRNESHFINRYRVDKWSRILNSFMK